MEYVKYWVYFLWFKSLVVYTINVVLNVKTVAFVFVWFCFGVVFFPKQGNPGVSSLNWFTLFFLKLDEMILKALRDQKQRKQNIYFSMLLSDKIIVNNVFCCVFLPPSGQKVDQQGNFVSFFFLSLFFLALLLEILHLFSCSHGTAGAPWPSCCSTGWQVTSKTLQQCEKKNLK